MIGKYLKQYLKNCIESYPSARILIRSCNNSSSLDNLLSCFEKDECHNKISNQQQT